MSLSIVKNFLVSLILLPAIFSCEDKWLTNIPHNTWIEISRDTTGGRRSSSIRYAESEGAFLLWGFHGYRSSYYGSPEKPWDGNNEYDIVALNVANGSWESHLPFDKQDEWAVDPPPMHMASYYQGITIGSHRPQLKVRDGILRPDLNIVFDQVTWDSRRNRMVYFTGGRTLAYDLNLREWSDICLGNTAPPVFGGSLCYDPVNDQIVLTGGGHVAELDSHGNLTGSAGTWIFDCEYGNWSPANCETEPPARMSSRLVYDNKNDLMVLFGGDHHTHYLSDTWIFDPVNLEWKKSETSEGPQARSGHFTVFDSETGFVIIGGGHNHEDLTDMWGYDVSLDAWQKLRGNVPTGFYIAADIMQREKVIILITNNRRDDDHRNCNMIYPVRTTYAFRINKKDLVEPDAQIEAHENLLKRSLKEALDGTQPDPSRIKEQKQRIDNMPLNQWVEFPNPGRSAPVRTWGSCSFDENRGRIVYWGGGHCGYGGNDYEFYDVDQNTWISSPLIASYPERNWDKSGGVYPGGLMFDGSPFMRHGRKAYAWDPLNDIVINMKYIYLTAGYEPEFLSEHPPVNPDFGSNENFNFSGYSKWVTWTYDDRNEKWELLCPAAEPGLDLLVSTPHGVMGVNYWWSALNNPNRLDKVFWENEYVVDNSVYLLDVKGKKWNNLTKKGPWPQNLDEMTALVYDSKRDQLLLHGGGPERNELWRFPLNSGVWERISPRFGPGTNNKPPTCRREAVYLPNDDIFFTAGRNGDNNNEPGFWAYRVEENRWYKLDIALPDGITMNNMVSQNRAWCYDPNNSIIFMVTGSNDGQAVVYGLKFRFNPEEYIYQN
jgi:hypothetical protein